MLTSVLRTASEALQTPVIFLLIAAAVITVVMFGMLIAEFFTEHRQFTLSMPRLVADLQSKEDSVAVVEQSGLLARQKKILRDLMSQPAIEDSVRESLAVSLVADEQRTFDNRVKVTDVIARISPMLGLMGTLIPLGPGLMALGDKDTLVLSQSLLVAFDTTIMGLTVAALALVVTAIRKQWYARYMSGFEAVVECVLEKASGHHDFGLSLNSEAPAEAAAEVAAEAAADAAAGEKAGE